MFRPLASALLALLLLAGPAAAEEPLHQDPQHRFSLRFPAGWTVGPDAAIGTLTTGLSPKEGEDDFQENLKVVGAVRPEGLDLEGYVANSLAVYRAMWKVKSDRATTVAGLPARRLVLDQTIGPLRTRILKYFIADDRHIYVISGSAAPGAFKRYLPVFEAAVASFAPGDWQAPTP